jgi:hypothetical protein
LGLLLSREESTPDILATKGNAVTASAARATAIKKYSILKSIAALEKRQGKVFARGIETVIRGDTRPLYILELIQPSIKKGSTEREPASQHESKGQDQL